ncbi:RNA polymerase sigma factor SigZ [Acaryochloris sp. IP29b_bin.148]|uniref:RNA polymerase sigma factor SigZ n=1 Tax=Acaryochloris sp. IP29b_bin.148 TaxID=2969218 RepID=UPI00261E1142|nr:RNA polymerase sigma factor SigZ [Acaryochloris sp. IP29b_bin.148]
MDIKQLWQDYREQLRQFLLVRVHNPSDVDDLLQDILIKSYQNLPTVKQPSKFQAWLFQIARNTLIDYYRQARLDIAAVDIAHLPQHVKETEAYEQIRQELAQCIRPFIAQLPDKYREAVDLVDLQGKSQKVLASELGLSHSAVKSRVQRGRRLLGSLVRECCQFQLDARGNPIEVAVTAEGCPTCGS